MMRRAHRRMLPIDDDDDIHKPFIVTTDASGTHVGGVLSQLQSDGTNTFQGSSKELNAAILQLIKKHLLWSFRAATFITIFGAQCSQ